MQGDADQVREVIHYKYLSIDAAECGVSGNIVGYESWDRVTCPNCLAARGKFFAKRNLPCLIPLGAIVVLVGFFLLLVLVSFIS